MWKANGNGHGQAYDSSWFEGSREALHELRERARGYGAGFTDRVKAHPLAAAGIAFAAGYVIARFARRR